MRRGNGFPQTEQIGRKNQQNSNTLYREDVFMLFTKSINTNSGHKLEELLAGLKKAGISPKEISGIQRKYNGTEIMCLSEKSYETLLEEEITVGQDKVVFQAKRKRTQAVRIFGLGMDVFDSVLEEKLSEYGQIKNGKQHQLKFKSDIDEEWKHVTNGDRIVYMLIEKSIPRRLMIANEWVQTWYVGQPKSCGHCGGDHKPEECPKVICYNCEEMGHLSAQCTKEKICTACKKGHGKHQCGKKSEITDGEGDNEDSELEEINSPEYSPIKESSKKEETWNEEEVIDKAQDKENNLYTRRHTREILEKLEREISDDVKQESSRLTEGMEAWKATEIFTHHMKELSEIRRNKSLNAEDKRKLNLEKHRWIYGTLMIMRNENIAGIHEDKLIRFKTKEEATTYKKRHADAMSPKDKSIKHQRY